MKKVLSISLLVSVIAESSNISIAGNLIEANDKSGVMIEFLYKGSEFIEVKNNQIQYNNGYGIESYAARMIAVSANNYTGNGNSEAQQKLSKEKSIIIMQ